VQSDQGMAGRYIVRKYSGTASKQRLRLVGGGLVRFFAWLFSFQIKSPSWAGQAGTLRGVIGSDENQLF